MHLMNIAITNGFVVPVDGETIDGGTVLIQDGKIVAVAPDAEVTLPAGITTVDAGGSWVLPGFVEAHGHLGVHEEAEGWAGQDTRRCGQPMSVARCSVVACQKTV